MVNTIKESIKQRKGKSEESVTNISKQLLSTLFKNMDITKFVEISNTIKRIKEKNIKQMVKIQPKKRNKTGQGRKMFLATAAALGLGVSGAAGAASVQEIKNSDLYTQEELQYFLEKMEMTIEEVSESGLTQEEVMQGIEFVRENDKMDKQIEENDRKFEENEVNEDLLIKFSDTLMKGLKGLENDTLTEEQAFRIINEAIDRLNKFDAKLSKDVREKNGVHTKELTSYLKSIIKALTQVKTIASTKNEKIIDAAINKIKKDIEIMKK